MSKKPMSWLELIKMKLKEEKGASMKDVMPAAKKDWAQIKAGTHPLYVQGKAQTFARKKKSESSTKTRKSMKSMKSASATPSDSSNSAAELEKLLAEIKLCGKCKKKVDKIMGKKGMKGGCIGSCPM
jgi:hypothetical protein